MSQTRAGPQTPGRREDTLGIQKHAQKDQNTYRQGPQHACHVSRTQKNPNAHSRDGENAQYRTRTGKNTYEKP